jgi:hypothetical protein
MNKFLPTAATLLAFAGSAHAMSVQLQCEAPQMLFGADANDPNPVVATAVEHSWDDHSWRVFHQLRSGAIVSRQAQYGMTDASATDRKTQWRGNLLRQPWLFMIGEVKQNKTTNEMFYHEWMYDSKRGNALVMQSYSRCTVRKQLPTPTAQLDTQPYAQPPAQTPPEPAPTQQPPASTASRPSSKDSIPIIVSAGGRSIHVDVLLGGMPIRMLVDTGAMGAQVPPSFASMLIRNSNAIQIEDVMVTLADGSRNKQKAIRIRDLRIGSHVIRNVEAVVTDGSPLLGFPIINSIAPFTIDTRAGELVWHTTRG